MTATIGIRYVTLAADNAPEVFITRLKRTVDKAVLNSPRRRIQMIANIDPSDEIVLGIKSVLNKITLIGIPAHISAKAVLVTESVSDNL